MKTIMKMIRFFLCLILIFSSFTTVKADGTGWSETEFTPDITITAWDGTVSRPSDYEEDLFLFIFGRQACGNTRYTINEVQKCLNQGYSLKVALMWIDNNNEYIPVEEIAANYPRMIVSDNYSYNQSADWSLSRQAGISGSTLPFIFLMNSDRKVVFSACSQDAMGMIADKIREIGYIDPDLAHNPEYFPLKLTYSQNTARTMLEMINSFRTGDETWAWNEDDSQKVWYEGLKELVYDYELEKVAMQRAAEIAVSYGHERPDGTSCFDAYPAELSGICGENIAMGYSTAAGVFSGWKEDNESYSGQGHRRNMLSGEFRSVGIGCAEYEGRLYWVQEFSSETADPDPVSYEETPVEVKIPVNRSDCSLEVEFDEEKYNTDPNIQLPLSESIALPSATVRFYFKYKKHHETEVTDIISEDTSIIRIENGKLKPVNEGETRIAYQASFGTFNRTAYLNIKTGNYEHVHNYTLDAWNWADDYTSASAQFVCATDSSHTLTLQAQVLSETVDPDCGSDGWITYTASVMLDGVTYTDRQVITLPATGDHTYTVPEYTWSEDWKTVRGRTSCTTCGMTRTVTAGTYSLIEKEPGCEEPGLERYYAYFWNNVPFETQTRDKEIPATGHDYRLKEWKWSSDYSEAEAQFVCQNDSSHSHSVNAEITSETTYPTCGTEGKTVYTAAVSYEGKEYTDIQTVTIPATGDHSFRTPEYTWSSDNKTVTAKAVCEKCGEEISETVNTSYQVIREATKESDGLGRYTAVFTNSIFTAQTKDVIIPKGSDHAPQSVSLNTHEVSIRYGDSFRLSAAVLPDDAEDKHVTWTSSDPEVASLDRNGNVKGVKPGLAVITATTVNGLTDTCEVRVLFSDVANSSQYFYEPVYWAVDNGITVGAGGAGRFSPDASCTREQIVTFLWRLEGEPEPESYQSFTDVKTTDWFYKPISWAASKGITVGLNDGTGRFGVGQPCTREQCVTFLHRTAGKPSVGTHQEFTDVASDRYYYDAISWAASRGITVGLNDGTGRFGVGQKCTRAMIVTFLCRYANQ